MQGRPVTSLVTDDFGRESAHLHTRKCCLISQADAAILAPFSLTMRAALCNVCRYRTELGPFITTLYFYTLFLAGYCPDRSRIQSGTVPSTETISLAQLEAGVEVFTVCETTAVVRAHRNIGAMRSSRATSLFR